MAKDIIELVEEKEAQAWRSLHRGVIISPAAIGDCLLTLPLASFMKKSLQLSGIDFIGHTHYIDFYPGRTCIDGIRSINSIDFHRLFVDPNEFVVEQDDSLISAFTHYEWIVSFMGAGSSDFENNLIFTVNCGRAAEITFLPLTPDAEFSGHISEFYIQKFIEYNRLQPHPGKFNWNEPTIKPGPTDITCGKKLLQANGIDPAETTVLIHPGSGGKNKCWHLENFCALATALAEKNIQVLFLLGPAESDRLDDKSRQAINAVASCASGLGLDQIMQIIACADCFVGNDSGITHLAAGLGISTLALFGDTNPVLYKPLGPKVKVLNVDTGSFGKASSSSAIRKATDLVSGMLDN